MNGAEEMHLCEVPQPSGGTKLQYGVRSEDGAWGTDDIRGRCTAWAYLATSEKLQQVRINEVPKGRDPWEKCRPGK
jgi:hypothetical protein